MVESLLLAVTRVVTMAGNITLTNATAFFFERNDRLFLVTARHVLINEPSGHRPDRLLVEFHITPGNVVVTSLVTISLYLNDLPLWREASDSAGIVDIAVIELDRKTLPSDLSIHAFNEASLIDELEKIEVGMPVLIVGFPLGFHDTLHRLPVARQAVIASAFGIRFQGHGYFLTDAQMHRGSSGAPVVARPATQRSGRGGLDWMLLGVHATRMDVANRDIMEDERLNLNCAWYADILLVLTL